MQLTDTGSRMVLAMLEAEREKQVPCCVKLPWLEVSTMRWSHRWGSAVELKPGMSHSVSYSRGFIVDTSHVKRSYCKT